MGHYQDQYDAEDERAAKKRAGFHDENVARITKAGHQTRFYDAMTYVHLNKGKMALTSEQRDFMDQLCLTYFGKNGR
jgi:hypothetical protein